MFGPWVALGVTMDCGFSVPKFSSGLVAESEWKRGGKACGGRESEGIERGGGRGGRESEGMEGGGRGGPESEGMGGGAGGLGGLED